MLLGCLKMPYNGFGLGEGGDFHHKIFYEAPKFKYKKICPTKHKFATLAKPVLVAGGVSRRRWQGRGE